MNHGKFPQEKLPECWDNDERMRVLFSPFRVRSVNPENYDGKMMFWKKMILEYCQWQGSAEAKVVDVEKAFTRDGSKPYCLETVFEDMKSSGDLRLKEDFLEPPQHTWMGYTKNLLVHKPLRMGFKVARNALFPPNLKETLFVVQEIVEEHASKLQSLLENRIISQSDVNKEAQEKLKLSPEGIALAIHALHCQQKVTFRTPDGECSDIVLKFAPKGDKVAEISDLEYSIYDLEFREKELTAIMEDLEEKVKHEEEKAREHVKKGSKNLAMLCLKKRKVLQNKIDKQTSILTNIQEMLTKIHDVTLNRKILQTMKNSGKTLKDALEKTGITLEMVEETVDEIREVIAVNDEVGAVLGSDFRESSDADLEQELAMLLEEDGDKNVPPNPPYDDLIKRLEALQIPTDMPTTSPRDTELSHY
uniref:Putative m protein type n=1 Tax=Nyssomyia neivai TaxID=330878 RepID=A0A1L8DAL2_9DIPT